MMASDGLGSLSLATLVHCRSRSVYFYPGSIQAPIAKVSINCLPVGKVAWVSTPSTPFIKNIKNSVKNLPNLHFSWATTSRPGSVNIKTAAIAKLRASKKKTCLAPMKAATLPAIPGPSTPSNW